MKMLIAILTFAIIFTLVSAAEPSQPKATTGAPLTAEQRAGIVAFFREYSDAMIILSEKFSADVKKSSFYEGNAAMAYYAANFVENFDGVRFTEKSPLSNKAFAQLGMRSNLKPAPPLSAAP